MQSDLKAVRWDKATDKDKKQKEHFLAVFEKKKPLKKNGSNRYPDKKRKKKTFSKNIQNAMPSKGVSPRNKINTHAKNTVNARGMYMVADRMDRLNGYKREHEAETDAGQVSKESIVATYETAGIILNTPKWQSKLSDAYYDKKMRHSKNEMAKQSGHEKTEKIRKEREAQNKSIQKAALDRKYQAAKREEEAIVEAYEDVRNIIVKAARKIAKVVREHTTIISIIIIFIIMVVIVATSVSSCAVAVADGIGIYLGNLSPSDDLSMTECENYFKEKEMLLRERIDHIEEEYPDVDEFVYSLSEIKHDEIQLMAFLSSAYESYTLEEVENVLDEIFEALYQLTMEEKTEKRTSRIYNQVSESWEEIEHEVNVLYVTLIRNDLDAVLRERLTGKDEQELYEIYIHSSGGHQAFYNPFDVDWNQYVSSEFGWRIHPISGQEKFHNGVDIALMEGTEIKACSSGKVVKSYYSASAGNYIIIEDERGYTSHYMHLEERYVKEGDEVIHGMVVGTVGNTGNSTGAHLHLGIQNESGDWLNPRFLVSTYVEQKEDI